MENKDVSRNRIKQSFVLVFVVFAILSAAFWLNTRIQSLNVEISTAEIEKEESFKLLEELRQSSNDLTNTARLYVTTGNTDHKEYFNRIIAIREGKEERPIDYHEVYWDFVLATGKNPRLSAEKIPLIDLIEKTSSLKEAKEHFIKAKNSSDDLVLIEEEAFNAMNGNFKDSIGNYTIKGDPNQKYAIELLHSDEYLTAKAKIMESIQDFSHTITNHINSKLNQLSEQRSYLEGIQYFLMNSVAIILSLILINLFTRWFRNQNKHINDQKTTFKLILSEIKNSWVILISIGISMSTVVVFLMYNTNSIKKDLKISLLSSLTTVHSSSINNIEYWLKSQEKSLIQFSKRNDVRESIVTSNFKTLNSHVKSQLQTESYEGFIITDVNGGILYSSNGSWMKESIKMPKDLSDNSALFQFPSNDKIEFKLSHLIKSIIRLNDKTCFVLLLNPKKRFSSILQLGRIGETGESYAFNKEGYMISESRFNKQLIEQGFLKQGQSSELNLILKDPTTNQFTFMASDATKGYKGSNIEGYNDYRGIKVNGVWSWSEEYGFGIATEIDFNEAYSSFSKISRTNLYTGTLFIILLISLSIVFLLDRVKLAKLREGVKRSELKFRSITETAQDAIVSANSEGVIESWNSAAEKIFGYSENEAIGSDLSIIVPVEYKDRHKAGMERVKSGGEKHAIGKTVELIGQHKSGRTFPIELSLSNWTGPGGMEFSGIIRDISERKKFQKALEEANERMSGELNIAKDIQMSMLPLTFPAFPKRKDIDIYADLIPAREVGGDFYDFHFIDDQHLCIVVGDVSGKGVPAALMMAVCKTLLKSKAGNDHSTASIMTQVNNEMAIENSKYMFVTVFLGILNTNTGELVYTNAGHNPTYIKRSDGSIEKLAALHGPVVAAMEGLTYGESKAQLETSEFIFAYTDGVPEAHNMTGELYGNDQMENFLIENEFNSPQRVVEDIISSVRSFENGAEKFDDLTALCIEFHGVNGASVKREQVKVLNDIANVPLVIDKFEQFGLANNIPLGISMKISIVLDELVANIVKYAYEDACDHEIYVEFKVSGDKLIIVIEDDGVPFNPFAKNPPDTKLSIDERKIGGLGIYLVKNLMDDCIYSRTFDKNVVTLTKYNLFE